MANCRTCGAEVAFKFGGPRDQCERCQRLEASQAPAQPNVVSPAPTNQPTTVAAKSEWLDAVTILIAMNVIVFILMVWNDPSAFLNPSMETLIRWGADFGPLTLDDQPWRVVTSSFLHIGIVHILVNMWSLWVLGRLAERFVGASSMLALYFLTGIGAGLASLAWDPVRVSAGASGPIFGYVGAMIGILYFAKDRLDPAARKGLLSYVVKIAVINLFIGLKSGIDNMAHIGGLITGAAIGSALVLLPRIQTQNRAVVRRNIFVTAFVLLILLFLPLRAVKQSIVFGYQGAESFAKKNYQTAIADFRKAVQEFPNDASAHSALGESLAAAGNNDEAMIEYKRTLELEPNDARTLRLYGEALLKTGKVERLDEAEQQFRKSLRLDSRDVKTHEDFRKVLLLQGKRDEMHQEDKVLEQMREGQGK